MKALLFLLTMTMTMSMSMQVAAGPRVTGNGGGGIHKNGVYKTFFSSGVYINPRQITDIPGAKIYREIISSLSGNGDSATKLYSAGLPIGDRKFYNILEERMDEATLKRLIEEYARVVGQPADDLTIFAITDIATKTTYLLPNFYKLSENEQATILFHEAYWLLNPKADYAEVVNAEMIFQEFLELREAGKYDHKLPRLLGKLLNDPNFALEIAVKEDLRLKHVPGLFDNNGTISFANVFINFSSVCNFIESYDYQVENNFLIKTGIYTSHSFVRCTIDSDLLQEVIGFQEKYPESLFLQELVSFLSMKNLIRFESHRVVIKGESKEENQKKLKKQLTKKLEATRLSFSKAKYITYEQRNPNSDIGLILFKEEE